MTPEERARHQHLQHELGDRAYLIWRSPWRVLRNRRLRREVAALQAESEALYRKHRGMAP